MGCAFGGILGMVEENFPTLSPTRFGNGSRIRFCHDFWCKGVALKSSVPK